VVIENVISRSERTTWWDVEAYWSNYTAKIRHDVGPNTRLEEHNRIGIILIVTLEHSSVHGLKTVVVEVARKKQLGISDPVSWVWLINRIKPNHIWVLSQSLAGVVPELDKFVLKLVLVVVKSAKSLHRLR